MVPPFLDFFGTEFPPEADGATDGRPGADSFSDLKRERVRAKNNKAQQKYRERKKEEKRALDQRLVQLQHLLNQADARLLALSREVKDLQALTNADSTGEDSGPERLYIPAREGYEGLDPLQQQGLVLEAAFTPPRKWTYAETQKLTLKDHCSIRKEMVLKAGQLLLSNPDKDPDCIEGQELRTLIVEMHGYEAYIADNQPVLLHCLMECRADACELPAEQPGSDFWRNILRKLRLSEQQQAMLLELYTASLAERTSLFARREQLRRSLMAYIEGANSTVAAYTEDRHHTRDRVQWANLVRAAQDNLDHYHIECCKFCAKTGSLWGLDERVSIKGLDVFQDAQFLTLAWPYFPHRFKLIAELAASKGHSSDTGAAEPHGPLDEVPDCAEDPYKTLSVKMLEAYIQEKLTLTSF